MGAAVTVVLSKDVERAAGTLLATFDKDYLRNLVAELQRLVAS
jgi:hypothetical protein